MVFFIFLSKDKLFNFSDSVSVDRLFILIDYNNLKQYLNRK